MLDIETRGDYHISYREETMKKTMLVAILCFGLALSASAASFSIKVNGGANLLFGGDYNKIVDGLNHPMYGPLPMSVSGEIKKLSFALDFGAEFILNFSDRMGLGLGVGYLTATNESSITASIMILSESFTITPSVSAFPITLNFHYNLPFSPTFRATVTAGPGLYIASFNFENHFVVPFILTDVTETFDAGTKLAVGVQGGLGLEYDITPSVSITFDVLGRLASLSDLVGTHALSGMILGITGSVSAQNHTFWYFEENGQPQYSIQQNPPSGAGRINVREASISLSGLCAMIGVKVDL